MRNVLCSTCSDALVANPEVARKLEIGQRFNDVQARQCSIHRDHPGDYAPGSDPKTDSDGTRSEEWPTYQTTPLTPLQQNPSATHSIMLTSCAFHFPGRREFRLFCLFARPSTRFHTRMAFRAGAPL